MKAELYCCIGGSLKYALYRCKPTPSTRKEDCPPMGTFYGIDTDCVSQFPNT